MEKVMTVKGQRACSEVTCEGCGVSFYKANSEINRNKKIGRKNYCSLNCTGFIQLATKRLRELPETSRYDISKFSNNRNLDNLSWARELIRRARSKRGCELKPEYLKTLWDSQNGLCALTKLPLEQPSTAKNRGSCDPTRAVSLDRKDSTKGYVEGNVQLVSVVINFAKNAMSDEQILDWLKRIKES